MTEFQQTLRQVISLNGPISVEHYMGMCLRHYYATRDPLGTRGDFTTAPEISQMFGELIGLWLAEVWSMMGCPSPLHIVELGPGRGTLMADALRAGKVLPGFLDAARVHLVETSPILRTIQKATLATTGMDIQWHEHLADVPSGPMLLVANEFFDALPVRQYVATERGWCERLVGLDGEHLVFGLKSEAEHLPLRPKASGDVLEIPATSVAMTSDISRRLVRDGGAALVIDYGYEKPASGDTLQALKGHEYASPLSDPGEVDLTTHVGFHHLVAAARREGAHVHGISRQAQFLRDLGIENRAVSLKQKASGAQSLAIDQALERLTDRTQKGMGELFKVLAITHPQLTSVPGLPAGKI